MRYFITFSVLLLTVLVIIAAIPVQGSAGEISGSVIRLHILANSDSDEDQAQKLCVRDAVLTEYGGRLGSYSSKSAAEEDLAVVLPEIESFAEKTAAECGEAYPVSVTLTEEYYPERIYEEYTFPEGMYTSLRIMIGEAEGHNWWCVLFPPLCVGAALGDSSASVDEDTFIAAGFTPEQYRIITGGKPVRYKLKFRIVEFFESIIG